MFDAPHVQAHWVLRIQPSHRRAAARDGDEDEWESGRRGEWALPTRLHRAFQPTLICPYRQPSLSITSALAYVAAFSFIHSTTSPARPISVSPTRSYSSTSASGRIVRISKIEIIGRKRMKRNNNVKKNPMVPTNIDQSHWVGR